MTYDLAAHMTHTTQMFAPSKVCERARRDDGLVPRLNCDICGRGPCGKKAPERRTPVYGWAIPNRLKGATINHEGDAV